MNDFLDDLLFHYLQKEHRPNDLYRHKDYEKLEELEKQIETAMGKTFWERYSSAVLQCERWRGIDAFRVGLRFGFNLMRGIEPGF